MFDADQHTGKPLSALAAQTGRHRGKQHARPNIFGAKRYLYLQPTGNRMVTYLPTESRSMMENGLSSKCYR